MSDHPNIESIKSVDKVKELVQNDPIKAFSEAIRLVRELADSADKRAMPDDFTKLVTMGPALATTGFVSQTEVLVALYQLGIRHGRAQATPAG